MKLKSPFSVLFIDTSQIKIPKSNFCIVTMSTWTKTISTCVRTYRVSLLSFTCARHLYRLQGLHLGHPLTRVFWQVLSPTRKETSYSEQTRDLFNILPTKLITLLSQLLQLLKADQQKKKNSEGCQSNQVSAAAMTSTSDEKWRPFNFFFNPGNSW